MTVKSRNAWNDILRACADMAENDTFVDEDEDEYYMEVEEEIPCDEAFNKAMMEFANKLRETMDGHKETVKVYVKGDHK